MTPRPDFAVGDRLPPITKTLSREKIGRFERLGRALRSPRGGRSRPRNIQTDPLEARRMGSAGPAASNQMSFAYLQELMARQFADDFLWGGRLAVTFLKPTAAGDALTAHGLIKAREEEGGRTRFTVEVWLENQRGEKIAAGEGRVTVPSPLRE